MSGERNLETRGSLPSVSRRKIIILA